MARTRRKFTPDFKAEVVELVRRSGKTVSEISKDMGVGSNSVHAWVAQADVDAGRRDGLTSAERVELAKMRKEIKVLREERDILKKAAAFFARETR